MSVGRRDFIKRSATGAAILASGPALLKSSAFALSASRFSEKSDVSFVGSSSTGSRKQMILDVLAPWKDTITAGINGKTVVVKPNMVGLGSGSNQLLPATHVDALRGVIDFIRSINTTIPIIVGDIPCNAISNLSSMFNTVKYNALKTEYTGVTLADFDKTNDFPAVERHFWASSLSATSPSTIPVTSVYTDAKYYVISVGKPKTHAAQVMTGVNKNILMSAPRWNDKQKMHAGGNKGLAYNLFQMANIIYPTGKPHFSVLDAWEGMEGEGPLQGTSVMQYCAVAGTDPLAVDRLCAKLMGFSDTANSPINTSSPSYTDIRYLVWISNAGLGNYDLDKINFILGTLSDLEKFVIKYKLSNSYTGNATSWTGGPPPAVFDKVATVKDSRFLDPKPYLKPQLRNTATGTVNISFSLPVSFKIKLRIHNLMGAEIRRLGDEFLNAGRYTIIWDGCDSRGSRVPTGEYIIRFGYDSGEMCDHVTLVR